MTTYELHVATKEGMPKVGWGSISVTDGDSYVQLNAIKKHLAGSKQGATPQPLYRGKGEGEGRVYPVRIPSVLWIILTQTWFFFLNQES